MIFEFPEFSKTAKVLWCHTDAPADPQDLIGKVRSLAPKIEAQFLDAARVAGRDHAYFAVLNALKAFQYRRNISKSLAVEIILYAAATRQIENAFKTLGISSTTRRVVCIAIASSGENLATLADTLRAVGFREVYDEEPSEWFSEKSDDLKRTFSIRPKEILAMKRTALSEHEILTRLVVERMALLAIET